MKKLVLTFVPIIFFLIGGCSNDSGSGTTDPFGGGGGGGTGNVTIQVDIGEFEGANWFAFNAGSNIKLNTAIITQAQLGINETINNPEPEKEFNAGEWYAFYQLPQGAAVGQQWTFRFQGTIVQGGQAFDKTVNYSVQGKIGG